MPSRDRGGSSDSRGGPAGDRGGPANNRGGTPARRNRGDAQPQRPPGGVLGDAVSPIETPVRRTRGSVGHGTRQRRAGETSGPVVFRMPRNSTPEMEDQAREYVDAANKALDDGKLAPGRVRVDGELETNKEKAARDERIAAEQRGEPYGSKVAAHLPDTTWSGTAQPPGGWGAHDGRLNSSLGSQSEKYPVGYQPTRFYMEGDSDVPAAHRDTPRAGSTDTSANSNSDDSNERPSRRGRR